MVVAIEIDHGLETNAFEQEKKNLKNEESGTFLKNTLDRTEKSYLEK